jgi:hypothetical protein
MPLTHAQGGVYLFLPRFSPLYDAIYGWMTGRIDGKLHEKRPRHPLLYVIRDHVSPLASAMLSTQCNGLQG